MAKVNASTTTSKPLVTASADSLRIAPRKMRLVTNLVKGMYVGDALAQLRHANKKAAPIVTKLLNSAIANAEHNFSLDPEALYIKSITTDSGRVIKRYFPRARGSAFAIRRRMSNVNVILEERKKGKAAAARTSFLRRKDKSEEQAAPGVDQKQATNLKPPKELGRKSEVPKTEQQVKLNQQQNKRRLFNRKSGE